jgi:tight adherence protein B
MSPMMISIVVCIAVTGMVGAVAFALKDWGGNRAEDRLQVMAGLKTPELEARGLLKEEVLKEGFMGLSGALHSFSTRMGNLKNLFIQADSPISINAFFGLSVGCAIFGLVGAVIANSPAPLFPVIALLFGSFPLCWLMLRRRSRFKKFAKQLPDALELVGRALRSGHSLASGMQVVVSEMPAPIAVEFGNVYEAQNLGIPIEQAMKDMLRRMPNLDLKFFVTSVVIQRQTGGDLAEILDKISHIIRERFKILGQVQALTGEGRISGIVLMALPIALFFVVYHLNPDYIMLLFTDPLGRKMIAVATVLQVLGAVCIKKIVSIKV